jgi:imidazolonepropionase-like amidohydrolase
VRHAGLHRDEGADARGAEHQGAQHLREALRETVRLVRGTPGAGEVLERVLAGNVARLREPSGAGGRFVSGTDAPLDHPGLSLRLNLRAMVRGGMSPREALTSATTDAAACLGRSADLGVLAPGRLADLALVEGDPLTDISAAARVRTTVVSGRVHSLDALLAWPPAPG